MHPQIISQEQNPGDPLTACILGVRKRRIKDDSYKWVDGGAKDWGWRKTEGRRGLGSSVHEQEQEALGKYCVKNTVAWTALPWWSSG